MESWQKSHVTAFFGLDDGTVIGRYIAKSSSSECVLFELPHVVKGTRALIAQTPADDFLELVTVLHKQTRLWPALKEGFALGMEDILTAPSSPSSHNLAKLFLVASCYPDLSIEFERSLRGANRFLVYREGTEIETEPNIIALFHKASEAPDLFVNRGGNLKDVLPWKEDISHSLLWSVPWKEKIKHAWERLSDDLRMGTEPAPDWVRHSLGGKLPEAAEERAPTP